MERQGVILGIRNFAHEIRHAENDLLEGGHLRRTRRSVPADVCPSTVKDFAASQGGALLGGAIGSVVFPTGEFLREVFQGMRSGGSIDSSSSLLNPEIMITTGLLGLIIGAIIDNRYSWRIGREKRLVREALLRRRQASRQKSS